MAWNWPSIKSDNHGKRPPYQGSAETKMPCGKKISGNVKHNDWEIAEDRAVTKVEQDGSKHIQGCKKCRALGYNM